MGKSTTMKPPINNMPPITDGPPIAEVKPVVVEVSQDLSNPVELKLTLIELPLGPLPGYVKRRVDLGRMTLRQSQTLASITSGLQFQEAKLADGTMVRSELHAIKWVLEKLTTE